jgi:hypothetical protein
MDEWIAPEAAKRGDVQMLQWVMNEEIRIDDHAVWNATEHGHIEVLRWLHEKAGCELTHGALFFARKNEHTDVIQYLEENCCPSKSFGTFIRRGRGHVRGRAHVRVSQRAPPASVR